MKYLLAVALIFTSAFTFAKEAEIGQDLNRQAIYFYGFDELGGFEEYSCVIDLGSFNLELEAVPHKKNGVQVGYKCVDYSYYLSPGASYMVSISLKPWPSDKAVPVTTFYIKP